MKRVLILANSSVGLYEFRNELLVRMLKDNEVFVSIPDEVKRKELEEEGCSIIMTSINRRGMNPFQDVRLLGEYNKILNKVKPDIVLTYTIKPNIYGGIMCRLKRIPYMVTITGLGSTFQNEGILKKLIVGMYRMALKKAECIFFQNAHNKKVFEDNKIAGKKSILVNGSGVNIEKHLYEEYPDSPTTRLLFVGRIMKEKGIEEFLKAAEMLADENTIFEILGGCDENYEDMLASYEARGIIKQYGFQTDVKSYLKRASALVLPTYHEGMSNVLMEASATGRPVIATNISGCKEVFEEGITGFGCQPQSVQGLVEAIEKFLKLQYDERVLMGQNARVKMEQEFDRRQIVDVYIKEIENAV